MTHERPHEHSTPPAEPDPAPPAHESSPPPPTSDRAALPMTVGDDFAYEPMSGLDEGEPVEGG